MRRRPARVHDALGNALVVEVRDLLAEDEVFEERRSAKPGLERVLVVGNRDALIGGERLFRRIDAHPIERGNRLVDADDGPAAAHLVRTVPFGHRAGPDDGIARCHRRSLLGALEHLRLVLGRLEGIEG